MAAMSLDSVIRSGGHLVLVGDPKQIPPTVLFRKAADLGLCISIFDRLHNALGDDNTAVVQLSLCYRTHPLLLSWPSAAFYNNSIRTGLTDPLTQRPPVAGLPWREPLPWDNERLEALAKATATPSEDLEKLLRELAPEPQSPKERHRFLLVDSPSLEVTSNLHSGRANLPEAAQTVGVVRALLPAMKNSTTVRAVVGYQLQCAVLEN
eukprot:5823778-Pyramimonas_sp.AAC.1